MPTRSSPAPSSCSSATAAAPRAYEFQTLLGVREELVARLVADGRTVRVYIPYGPQWYDYAMRRMRESPHVAGHVARAVVSRAVGRIRRPSRRSS